MVEQGAFHGATEGALRATGVAPSFGRTEEPGIMSPPDPEVLGKKPRRKFTARYKLRILEEADACKEPGQLTVHADRGPSMKSKVVAQLLADLGVTKTHGRPHVSNDNPYSESQFKTLKYRPKFPDRFGSIQDTSAFCQPFFNWYNKEHRHSGIALMTPEQVHYGQGKKVFEFRSQVLSKAFRKNPIRFKGKMPKPCELPKAVWINRPPTDEIRV